MAKGVGKIPVQRESEGVERNLEKNYHNLEEQLRTLEQESVRLSRDLEQKKARRIRHKEEMRGQLLQMESRMEELQRQILLSGESAEEQKRNLTGLQQGISSFKGRVRRLEELLGEVEGGHPVAQKGSPSVEVMESVPVSYPASKDPEETLWPREQGRPEQSELKRELLDMLQELRQLDRKREAIVKRVESV